MMDIASDTTCSGETKTFLEIERQIQHLLTESTPENHEFFFSGFWISNEQRRQFIEDIRSLLKDTLSGARNAAAVPASNLPVPKVIHRIWLTDPKSPALPPEEYLKRIKNQCKRLEQEYKVVFWHNSERTASTLAEHFPGTEIDFRDIASLGGEPQLSKRIDSAIAHQKYVLAGDISKYLILKEIGGVYADLGVDFGKDLLDLVHISDVSLLLDSGLFFQPAFMAAPMNSNPFRVWCSLLSQPEVMSAVGLRESSKFTAGNEIWIHGGVGFTAALILFYDASYNILPVPPNRGLLHLESQGSWYRPGNRYGNVTLASAPVTHLNWDQHSTYVRLNQETEARLPHLSGPSRVRLNVARNLAGLYWLK